MNKEKAMKRTLSILLIFLLVFTFASCGKERAKDGNETDAPVIAGEGDEQGKTAPTSDIPDNNDWSDADRLRDTLVSKFGFVYSEEGSGVDDEAGWYALEIQNRDTGALDSAAIISFAPESRYITHVTFIFIGHSIFEYDWDMEVVSQVITYQQDFDRLASYPSSDISFEMFTLSDCEGMYSYTSDEPRVMTFEISPL